MADLIDLANEHIAREVSSALNKIKQDNSTKVIENNNEFCLECGEKIPLGRRKLGFTLCVPCAEDAERKKALFAG